ncbi:MAG: hypothetical protein ACOC4Y_00520 [bacterium]
MNRTLMTQIQRINADLFIKIKLFLSIALFFIAIAGNAQELTLEDYIAEYDYE